MMTEHKISHHRYALEAVGEEGSADSRASSFNHRMHEISSLNYFQGSGGGIKVTLRQLTKKLKSLEEEAKFLKQTFFESMEERRKLVDEIHVQLQIIRCSLPLKNQVKGEESCGGALLINPLKEEEEEEEEEGRTGTGLSQILCQESNSALLLVRDLSANAILPWHSTRL